jgi:ketosteroid isomerase-like protein
MFAAVRDRDLEAYLDTCDEGIVIEEAESLPYGGRYRGHEGAIEHAAGYLGTWERLQRGGDADLGEAIFEAGDQVVALWRQRASAADGERLDLPAVTVAEVRGGRVIGLRMHHFDTLAIVRFLEAHGDEPRR